MTTIAVNHTSIACDLQITSGDHKLITTTKIVKVSPAISKVLFDAEYAYVGFSGEVSEWAKIMRWFGNEEYSPPPRCKTLDLLALCSNGHIYTGNYPYAWIEVNEPHQAVGSGAGYAIGAMDGGASPYDAVIVASKHDINTGMGFKEYML